MKKYTALIHSKVLPFCNWKQQSRKMVLTLMTTWKMVSCSGVQNPNIVFVKLRSTACQYNFVMVIEPWVQSSRRKQNFDFFLKSGNSFEKMTLVTVCLREPPSAVENSSNFSASAPVSSTTFLLKSSTFGGKLIGNKL